jgi:misacylated tRNA(Ala) deacylase
VTQPLFYDDGYLRSCEAQVVSAGDAGIVLDVSVFYPAGGGQPGDIGTLRLADGHEITIVDTRKGEQPGAIMHVPAPDSQLPQIGERVLAAIDWERRHRHMRIHTCLHLLSAVVPAGVTGGSIGAQSGRLDFDLPDRLLDKEEITAGLNRLIEAGHAVCPRWIDAHELDARPELVKTMSVKPPMGSGRVRLLEIPNVDLQACGGTHVANTREIGRVVVTKIEKKSTHNRRVVVSFAGGD